MKLKLQSPKTIEQSILEILGKYLDLDQYKVFLFGSRAAGNNFSRADIDIGIEGSEPLNPEIKLSIEEEFENLPTLYKIDLVDFADVSNRFRQEALKHIKPINA